MLLALPYARHRPRRPDPRGIELSLRLAGPTARALAWVIDLVVRVAATALLGTALGILGKFGAGLMLIVWFALEGLYPTVFEVWFGAHARQALARPDRAA